jgi:YidC/Oxa1 family membrane protein insertase
MPLIFANILQPLVDAGEAVMVFFHDNVGLGWGLSIIALTVTIRLLILPLTLKQFSSMREMQMIQPQVKALQAKYKDDRQRMNQEMMKLYQEHGVNPLGSCLPLVLQLPVFFSLFYMLRHDLRHDICPSKALEVCGKVAGSTDQGFLIVKDLTDKATGGALIVLIILYIGSQLVSSIMTTATMDKTQRYLMLGMPFMFSFFILSFPAGLIVYWITTNTWTIGQQLFVRRRFGPPPAKLAAVEAAAESAAENAIDRIEGKEHDKKPSGKDSGNGSAAGGNGSGSSGSGGLGGLLDRVRSGGSATATAPPAQRTTTPPPPPRKKKRKRSGRKK